MASPRPVPSEVSLTPGTRKKSSKISKWNSGLIPGPVSETVTHTAFGLVSIW